MGRERKKEGELMSEGPGYLLHYENRDFWKRVKVKALSMDLSVKDLIIALLKEKLQEKGNT